MKDPLGESSKTTETSNSQISNLYSFYIVICVANVFFSYTAISLNIITIHAIRKTSSLPTTLKTLLLSLAVSDLGVGLLVQPFYSALLVKQLQGNSRNWSTYSAFIIIVALFSFASLFGVMALSVDRFLAVHLHLRYQELVTHKRVVAVVISIWVLSAFISLLTLWIPTNIYFVIFSIIDVVCLITTTLLNYKIYLAVRRLSNPIQALQMQEIQEMQEMQEIAHNDEITNVVSVRKAAVGTFYLYLLFLVCYLPHICSYVAFMFSASRTVRQVLLVCTLTVVFLNSSLNPVVYCLKMRHIRRAAMAVLRSIFPCHN